MLPQALVDSRWQNLRLLPIVELVLGALLVLISIEKGLDYIFYMYDVESTDILASRHLKVLYLPNGA